MLVATSAEFGEVNLLAYQREEIEEFREGTWYCRSCEERLILKNGAIMRPHFAHQAHSHCHGFSEGETEEHLAGKALLAAWCDEHQLDYQLEAYLPALKQRPDILINQQIAIEFQCSPLPLARFQARTLTYLRHGYHVIWLMGKDFFLKKSLRQLARSSLQHSSQIGYYLWELDVKQEKIVCRYHLEEVIGQGNVYYQQKNWSGEKSSLVDIFKFPQKPHQAQQRSYVNQLVLKHYFQQLAIRLRSRQPSAIHLQEKFYQEGTHLSELSTIYFLPVTRSLFLGDETIYWRWQIWQFLLREKNHSLEKMEKELWHLFSSVYKSVHPLIPSEFIFKDLLSTYLIELTERGYLTIDEGHLDVLKKPQFMGNSEIRWQSLAYYLGKSKHISGIPRKNMLL